MTSNCVIVVALEVLKLIEITWRIRNQFLGGNDNIQLVWSFTLGITLRHHLNICILRTNLIE